MNRLVGPLLAVLLLLGIGFAGYRTYTDNQRVEAARLEADKMESVRGLIGSEKEGSFNDPRVQEILRRHSLTVTFEKIGSRVIAQRVEIKSFDFAHPAGAPAAQKIQQSVKGQQVFTPFFTPMVVASWKQLLPTLMAEGIVKKCAFDQRPVSQREIPRTNLFTLNCAGLLQFWDVCLRCGSARTV